MNSLLHDIRFKYGELGPREKRIADYILENPEAVLKMSVSELSDVCGCGDATVVRFSKKMGTEGFGMLKIRLSGELQKLSSLSAEITKDDSPYTVFQKRNLEIIDSLRNTETVLDPIELERAARSIISAKRIVIFGLGSSAPVAKDAEHKFLRIGLSAQACTDNHMQAIIASHLERGSVAMGISHSGASKDVIEALRLAKAGGATTIAITNFGKPPITETSDIVLFTKAEETSRSILAMSSRIAQLAILDSLYSYIVLNLNDRMIKEIFNTEFSLKNKKI